MPLVIGTLQILSNVAYLKLPSMDFFKKKFITKIFKQFEQTFIGDSDFLNSLFRCLTQFIKTRTFEELSEHQLRTLISVIKQNLDTYSA